MKKTNGTVRPRFTLWLLRGFVGVVALIGLGGLPRPATAQVPLGAVVDLAGIAVLGTDVGYDPVNDRYLFVGAHGRVFAMCTNAIGQVTLPLFDVVTNPAVFAHFPRAKYSPEVNGGAGGFLVTWHQNDIGVTNAVHGRIVSCTSGPTSPEVVISNIAEDGTKYTIGAPVAYSTTSHRFLVTWQTETFGIRGRFVSAAGDVIGGTMLLANLFGSRDPGIAWNAATDEFGLSYTGWDGSGAFAAFRKIRAADGVLSPLQRFWFGTGSYNTDITVNTATGTYVMGFVGFPGGSHFAHFDSVGNLLNFGLMTTRFGGSDNLSVGFNAASGTILGAGQDYLSYEVAAIEMNGGGAPISVADTVTQGSTAPGSFYPRIAARTNAGQWGLSFSRRYGVLGAQFVAAGGATIPPPPAPPPPSGGCTGPDPFAVLGGGTCVNGGWLPPGSGGGSTGGCTSPDPFTAIGGGTCVNGGWLPPGSGGESTRGCPSPDPFTAIGGGTCVNGGWLPPGSGGGSAGGCTSPDPFAVLGGGTCVNGGWLPPGSGGSATSGGCTSPDPFAVLGGGTCVNGGWLPPGSGGSTPGGCTTPDPFVAIGGGICINGGWHPKGRP